MTGRVASAVLTLIACAAVAPGSASAAEPQPRTPIRHFVSLMQENHSFDNYFGTYPGADGIPKGTCVPVNPRSRRAASDCVRPYRIGSRAIEDLGHSARIFSAEYRRGRMDGFVDAVRRQSGAVQPLVMGHYDDRDLPYYWNLADNYVLFDRFFTSAHAGSVINHMYWVTGRPGNGTADDIPPGGFHEPTIFERLEAKGISWKFYVQNYDPRITFRTRELGDRGSQIVWVPLLSYPRFLDNPRLFRHIVPIEEFYEDARRGTLPSVSYIVPSGSSEHPPGSIRAGETFVRTLITSMMRSRLWKSSAFTWTYDDWGGWYDHVRPPRVDRFGYGFRAPALLVSPWARRGYIDHRTLDFTSLLKFIEDNWGLEPLARRDREAGSLMSAFDFGRRPREAVLLDRVRDRAEAAPPRRLAVYIGYSAALVVAVGLIVAAAISDRRRPPLAGPSTTVRIEPLLTAEPPDREEAPS